MMRRMLFVAALAPALLSAEGKWGYIDTLGNWVIQPQYKAAFGFTDSDWSAVQCPDDSWIYIDRTGRTRIPRRFIWANDFCEGRAFVEQDGGQGLIDTTGSCLSVFRVDEGLEFRGGRGAGRVGEHWGYVDRNGMLAIFPQYAEAQTFHEGRAVVGVGDTGVVRMGCIDTLGNMVIPAQYDLLLDFSDGRARFCRPGDSVWGYLDRVGRVAIEARYRVARDFAGGLAAVRRDGRYGYIDTTGTFVIEPQFDGCDGFAEDLAAVMKDGKWGYIDRSGRLVIPAQYDYCGAFSDGRALVNTGGERRFLVGFVGGTTCFINCAGKPVITIPMRDARSFRRGLAAVKVDDE